MGRWLPGRRSFACAAAVLVVALVHATAQAQAPAQSVDTFRLVVERGGGAEECADDPTIAADVAARLGRNPFRADATRSLVVSVQRDSAEWIGRVSVRNESGAQAGSREIRTHESSCASLSQALSLTIALAIDPEATARSTAVANGPAANPTNATGASGSNGQASGATGSQPSTRAPATHGFDDADRTRGRFAVRAVLGIGLLPGAAPGVALAGETVLGARWTAVLEAFPETSATDRFSFGLWSAGLYAGGTVRLGSRVRLAFSGGVRLGALHGVVHPPTAPVDPGQRVWFALGANARAIVHLVGPLVAEAGLDLFVPITRMRFFVEDAGGTRAMTPIFEQSFVGVSPMLGLGFGFP